MEVKIGAEVLTTLVFCRLFTSSSLLSDMVLLQVMKIEQ
jgi:hypothetical protein